MDAKKIGKVIADLRKEAGFTQKSLSEALSVTDKAVSKWERGLSCPDISLLPKLSILLNTDIEAIIAGDTHRVGHRKGIIILEDKTETHAGTPIYDKPLVYYLLSHFLLIGVKDILIIAGDKDKKFIQNNLAKAERIGLNITYSDRYDGENLGRVLKSAKDFICDSNVLLVFGKMMLYGANITKQFQNITSHNVGGVRLVLYDGKSVPIFFCNKDLWRRITVKLDDINDTFDLSQILDSEDDISARRMGRGIIGLPINTYDEAIDAAEFVRLIQKTQSQYVSCVEEIAWRRGFINDEQLYMCLNKITDKKYREYLKSLIQKCI